MMLNENIGDLILTISVLGIAVLELRRGLRILVRNEVAFFTGIPLLLNLLSFFEFHDFARKIEDNLSDQKTLKASGILGLILGIILIISCLVSLRELIVKLYI